MQIALIYFWRFGYPGVDLFPRRKSRHPFGRRDHYVSGEFVDIKARLGVVRPQQEPKAFRRVIWQPGENRTLTFSLNARDFQFYDRRSHQ